METQPVFVGIDVGKAQLDVARSGVEEVWMLSNDEAGIQELVTRLREVAPESHIGSPPSPLQRIYKIQYISPWT